MYVKFANLPQFIVELKILNLKRKPPVMHKLPASYVRQIVLTSSHEVKDAACNVRCRSMLSYTLYE